MTPFEATLRELLEKASPVPWELSGHGKDQVVSSTGTVCEFGTGIISQQETDAALIALAPDLARLCLEQHEALRPYVEKAAPHEQLFSGEDLRNYYRAEAALAAFEQMGEQRDPEKGSS